MNVVMHHFERISDQSGHCHGANWPSCRSKCVFRTKLATITEPIGHRDEGLGGVGRWVTDGHRIFAKEVLMTNNRLPMRKMREVLRLEHVCSLGEREIVRS